MKRSLLDGDELEIEKPKWVDLLRPFIGAVVGVCVLWAFTFLGQDLKQAQVNATAFVSPGILAVIVLKLYFLINITAGSPEYNIIVITVASVPAAIIGAMAFSRKNKVRIAAGELFVLYAIFCMSVGLLGLEIFYPLLETP